MANKESKIFSSVIFELSVTITLMLKNSYPTSPLFVKCSDLKTKKAVSLMQKYLRLTVFIIFFMGL